MRSRSGRKARHGGCMKGRGAEFNREGGSARARGGSAGAARLAGREPRPRRRRFVRPPNRRCSPRSKSAISRRAKLPAIQRNLGRRHRVGRVGRGRAIARAGLGGGARGLRAAAGDAAGNVPRRVSRSGGGADGHRAAEPQPRRRRARQDHRRASLRGADARHADAAAAAAHARDLSDRASRSPRRSSTITCTCCTACPPPRPRAADAAACYDGGAEAADGEDPRAAAADRALREAIGDPARAHIAAFAVSPLERTLAVRLGVPIYGCDPDLRHLGSKSGGRSIMREAGVDDPRRRGEPRRRSRHRRTRSPR